MAPYEYYTVIVYFVSIFSAANLVVACWCLTGISYDYSQERKAVISQILMATHSKISKQNVTPQKM